MVQESNKTEKSSPINLHPLLPYESYLINAVLTGTISAIPESKVSGSQTNHTTDRTVRGQFLTWLCSEFHAISPFPDKQLEIHDAIVEGEFDLAYLKIDYPLLLVNCTFEQNINFTGTKFLSVKFQQCKAIGISGNFLKCNHSFAYLDGSIVGLGVTLHRAVIDGNLRFEGSFIKNENGLVLDAQMLSVGCHAYFNVGFQCYGSISLMGSSIGGNLVFTGAKLESPDKLAIDAEQIRVTGGVYLSDGFQSRGNILFSEARIGGRLQCDGGTFQNPQNGAFDGDGIKIDGPALFRNGFKAYGTIKMYSANLGSDLDCSNGYFEAPDQTALDFSMLATKGSVKMDHGFHAVGTVRLVGARIDGSFDCTDGHFENPKGSALIADSLVTRGPALFRYGFSAQGSVHLYGANIGGELDCDESQFSCNDKGVCILGQQMIVHGDWRLRKMKTNPTGELWLTSAKVGRILDDETSWPKTRTLIINGFEYDSFLVEDLDTRLKWINLQNASYTEVQPYEQLASSYRRIGRRENARRVLIEKERHILSQTKGFFSRTWKRFLGATIDFGYTPYKVFIPIILFIVLGTVVFGFANLHGVITPTSSPISTMVGGTTIVEPYPVFEPLLYSLDVFLPIVDLHQESYWLPNTAKPYGIYFMVYMIFHITAGWALTTLGVAAVTGLVRID